MMTMIADDNKLLAGFDIVKTALSVFGAIAVVVVPILISMVISDSDRAEALKLADYQAFSTTQEEFNTLLDNFTREVASGNAPADDLVQKLSTNIVQQYAKADAYQVNLPNTDAPLVDRYLNALNEVKKNVQTTDTLEEMNPLGVALVEMYRSLEGLKPVMERAAGKPAS